MAPERTVPLSSPDITEAEVDAAAAVLRSGRLSRGPQLRDFENAVAARAGRKFGIGVNSGTSGLHLCVRALGLSDRDEVITTPFSFIATTNCILFERAKPVFVDIDPETYNLDPDAIEAAITPRTKAILPVEVFGNTVHFDRYDEIARKHGLHLIEDCCEALGSRLDGRPAGSFGNCSVFGFYPNKQITTGEGGVVVTDDERIADLCRNMRTQGKANGNETTYRMMGYNYRLSEVNAAIGLVQTQRLDEIIDRRSQVAQWYNEALAAIPEIHLPPQSPGGENSWFVYVIRLADSFSPDQRAAFLDELRARGVGCEQYFFAIHIQPYVRQAVGCAPGDFPVCERVSERTVALPFFTNMTQEQVETVAQAVRDCLGTIKG